MKNTIFLLLLTIVLFFSCNSVSPNKTEKNIAEKTKRNTLLDKIPINSLPIDIYMGERKIEFNLKKDTLTEINFAKCFMPIEKFAASDYYFQRIIYNMIAEGFLKSSDFEVFRFITKSGIECTGLYFSQGNSFFLSALDENMNRTGKLIQLYSGFNENTGTDGSDIKIKIYNDQIDIEYHSWTLGPDDKKPVFSDKEISKSSYKILKTGIELIK